MNKFINLTELGLTPEQFNNGFIEFRKNNPEKKETGTLMDRVLSKGMQNGEISVVYGESNIESRLCDYLKYLKNK